jgi:hypothetical protein
METRRSNKRRTEGTGKREEEPMKRATAVKLLCKEQTILLAAIALFGSGFAGVVAYYEFLEETYGLYALLAELLVLFAILLASAMFFGCAVRIVELTKAEKEKDNGDRKGYIQRLCDYLRGDAGLHSSMDVLENVLKKGKQNGKPRTHNVK